MTLFMTSNDVLALLLQIFLTVDDGDARLRRRRSATLEVVTLVCAARDLQRTDTCFYAVVVFSFTPLISLLHSPAFSSGFRNLTLGADISFVIAGVFIHGK